MAILARFRLLIVLLAGAGRYYYQLRRPTIGPSVVLCLRVSEMAFVLEQSNITLNTIVQKITRDVNGKGTTG